MSPSLATAKLAYTARHALSLLGACHVTTDRATPQQDDLVVARVTEIGHHTGLALGSGRRASLFVGDEVVVAYGARYAPDQFLARVPADLGTCHLVAAGGVAARVVSAHTKMRPPTVLEPVGLLAGPDGQVVTMKAVAPLPARSGAPTSSALGRQGGRPPVLAVLGSSMNAGKTSAVASLVRGLHTAGMRVGAAKVTGTGAPGDPGLFADAGATVVLDFTDAGHATTFECPVDDLVGVSERLVDRLAVEACDVVVIEVADGLLQADTAALLAHPRFAGLVDATVFAAADALGAAAGVARLEALDYRVLAVSGLLTASPLAAAEAQQLVSIPVIDTPELRRPEVALPLLARPVPRAA
jgi:molybdopterin-guanine dinucleotide biosynthesis protein